MSYEILDKINSPADLKVLPREDIGTLASEIRDFLINKTNKNGGHLASNLGMVEITLAMHRVFNSPDDHIVFDVGHQSYVHKLITGRRELFDSLRTCGGLSGFPKISESEHDAFGTGHSSTSISASIGFATADKLSGKKSYTVCVIGDGAFTGGMIHEGLNNIPKDMPLIIILNENGMAISKNQGTFADYISDLGVKEQGVDKIKKKRKLESLPWGKAISCLSSKIRNKFYSPNYFEKFGFQYIGVIDGHDFDKLEEAFSFAKTINKPVLIHVKTQKGRGYSKAELNPSEFHNVNKSRPDSTFSSVFVDKLIDLAKYDKSIIAVTPAMSYGTELYRFGQAYPDRYFDVGIAEAHALTFSAALAKSGMKPFVATYSTFLQRAYDNLIHDLALQKLSVKIIIDRAGLAVNDGATHHGIFDVAYLSEIPGMTLFAPMTYSSLSELINLSVVADSPVAIRYCSNESEYAKEKFFVKAKAVNIGISADFDIDFPPEYVFVTYGRILDNVINSAEFLRAKGLTVGIILTEIIKPYDFLSEILIKLSGRSKRVLYVEEGIENGGAAVLTMNALMKMGFDFSVTEYRISAIDDNFASPEYPCDLYDYLGLSSKKLVEKMIL